MAGLLVSVRSAEEAREALEGGASVIDVKEPARGPLGRADRGVWREVVEVVEGRVPVSVALGELGEWEREARTCGAFEGLRFGKLGLAGEAKRGDWAERWGRVREEVGGGVSWVAVVYADWRRAEAPEPGAVVEEAVRSGCSGVLIDTFDKGQSSPVEASGLWRELAERVRAGGLMLALAGRVDEEGMRRLAGLEPDLFAVRGSACGGGDRMGVVEAARVARLVEAARGERRR